MKISSKDQLANSFIELAINGNLNKITVKKVVEFCGIGRQTFYNHFGDIYDLVSFILHRDLEEITSIYKHTADWHESATGVYEVMHKNKDFYVKLAKAKYLNNFMESLWLCTNNHYIDSILKRDGRQKLPKSIIDAVEYHCHGMTNMNMKWINGGMKESSREMADFCLKVMPSVIKEYLIDDTP